jgi:hypothetical protein
VAELCYQVKGSGPQSLQAAFEAEGDAGAGCWLNGFKIAASRHCHCKLLLRPTEADGDTGYWRMCPPEFGPADALIVQSLLAAFEAEYDSNDSW